MLSRANPHVVVTPLALVREPVSVLLKESETMASFAAPFDVQRPRCAARTVIVWPRDGEMTGHLGASECELQGNFSRQRAANRTD